MTMMIPKQYIHIFILHKEIKKAVADKKVLQVGSAATNPSNNKYVKNPLKKEQIQKVRQTFLSPFLKLQTSNFKLQTSLCSVLFCFVFGCCARKEEKEEKQGGKSMAALQSEGCQAEAVRRDKSFHPSLRHPFSSTRV